MEKFIRVILTKITVWVTRDIGVSGYTKANLNPKVTVLARDEYERQNANETRGRLVIHFPTSEQSGLIVPCVSSRRSNSHFGGARLWQSPAAA
jgi:hypothetical protein